MTKIIDHILAAPTWSVLGLVVLIVFVEDASSSASSSPARPPPCWAVSPPAWATPRWPR